MKPLIQAASGQTPARVPVWFMRQAGRSLPEYLEIRGEGSILNAISDPKRAAEITLQPTRRYDIDGAVLFSDIITPLWAMDAGIDIKPGVGPVTEKPFRSYDDLNRLRPLTAKDLWFQAETIDLILAEVDLPLIGFCGAPFTLATYLIEGKPSKNHSITKQMMFAEPALFEDLCTKLTDIVITSLQLQIESGASIVQLFDSWAGALHPNHYEQFVAPHSKRIIDTIKPTGVPIIHFGTGTSDLLQQIKDTGPDVVGVDWKTPLGKARAQLGDIGLQGNLDPCVCLGPWENVKAETDRILAENNGHPGYIFNLGHGVLPATNPDILAQLADYVHEAGTNMLKSNE